MLRMDFLRQLFGLSDEGPEDAIYDSHAVRVVIGIDLAHESVLDATTLLKFRRLVEGSHLTGAIFREINASVGGRRPLLCEGTMVDETIIEAPSSTKTESKALDAKMHQTNKGNAWRFGRKAHIGENANSGLVHSVHAALLHGQAQTASADAVYTNAPKRYEIV
jgi:IS5 family transposase